MRVLTRGRLLAAALIVLVAIVAYSAWLVLQVRSDLRGAETSARDLQAAIEDSDDEAREAQLRSFQDSADSAAAHTDGAWWGAFTYLPLVGDDAEGIRALSTSLDLVATDGVGPLSESAGMVDGLIAGGQVDLEVLEGLQAPIERAHTAFREAALEVEGVDSSGFAGAVKGRFERYVALVDDATRVLASADKATQVLPGMVGADGPRDYLLVFQNNAEIRATGGMPGSWAVLHTDAGQVDMLRQGRANFGRRETPILPLSEGELAVYDNLIGTYYQDAGFTPDFPRAAELLGARWQERFPETDLDGVIAIDPVALSYLLEGAGSVPVDGVTLTADNLVSELLNQTYIRLPPGKQDAFFEHAARAVFDKVTGGLDDPVAFVRGVGRAADEGRLLVASYLPEEREALQGSRVLGAMSQDDGKTPHVDIGLNDATGSKMSYYLRYSADIDAQSCADGRQVLRGTMNLSQSIPAADAAALPASVNGGGHFGTDPGSQLVLVRLYGPWQGTIGDLRVNGKAIKEKSEELDGRPVLLVVTLMSSTKDVVVTWSMETGEGQTGDGHLGMTPSVVPGSNDAPFGSAC